MFSDKMAKNAEKNGKQCSLLDIWQQKTSQLDTQTVQMATKCSQKQEADDALKRIFGYEAYKSDVQQKAVSAVLTGLFPLLWSPYGIGQTIIRTSWVVNFALFRCYRPVIYTRPP